MNFRPTLLVLALSTAPLCECAAGGDSSQPARPASASLSGAATLADVPTLIEQLGSPRFAERRRAEEQLLRLGPDAYDLISQAEDHEDPEVNERIAYIRLCLRIDWIRPDDPLPVRRLLTKFRALQEDGRIECIQSLAALPSTQGVAPLVRIARFDAKETVARSAALEILEMSDEQLRRGGALARAYEAESGAGLRPTLAWIHNRLISLDRPADAVAPLAEAVDELLQPLMTAEAEDEAYEGDDGRIAFRLLDHLLDRSLAAGDEDAMAATLLRVVDCDLNLPRERDRYGMYLLAYSSRQPRTLFDLMRTYVRESQRGRGYAGLCLALDWSLEHQQWNAANAVAAQHRELILGRRGTSYLWAGCLQSQGRRDEAEALADAVFAMRGRGSRAEPDKAVAAEIEGELEENELGERMDAAGALADRGFIPWAVREYRTVVDHSELASYQAVGAREKLAQWLHDDQQYGAAAEVLGEFCDAVKNDAAVHKAFYEEWPSSSSPRRYLAELNALRYMYAACQSEADGDPAQQLAHLEQAVELNEENPDILIALYRLQHDDAESQRRTVDRIHRVGRKMRAQVSNADDDTGELAQACNQLAWLIGNTEGDYEYALELSQRSLELAPDEPSFLDTLGRCYYAVGDLDNAVKAQTRACELSPHVQVMQRQLKFFKAEQAAQK
ncbi:MAG: hypothetical protein KDA44_21675 [Planctomycetales bacterium]|nr:hypothetical protein [Planctomycetales bacterium]